MKIVDAIIQARLTSTRFPRKVLEMINGQTVLGNVITRLNRCKAVRSIVLAIPNTEANDELREFSSFYQIGLYRGDENDVLQRFIQAAEIFKVNHILRVCADSPFILPGLIDYCIYKYNLMGCDYFQSQGMVMGQNIEIVRLDALKKSHKFATAEEKEHVTLYIQNHPSEFNIKTIKISSFAIDEKSDLRTLKEMAKYYE